MVIVQLDTINLLETPLQTNDTRQDPDQLKNAPQPPTPHSGFLRAVVRIRTFEALRHPQFRLIWFGHVFASMAMWMDQVTRGWLIYELTNSSFQLGLVWGVQALPILLLSPIAGSLADRYSRKVQVLIAQGVNGFLFASLAALIFSDRVLPWHVYTTAILMAGFQTFQQPARAAMVSDVVPQASLTNAIGLNAMIFNVARITGPALAGVLIAASGTGAAYTVQAACYALASLWTWQLDLPRLAPGHLGTSGKRENLRQSIVSGWKFSWQCIEVRTGLLVAAFASLLIIPFNTLLPVYARDLLAVGAKGQGLLLTAMGIGALTSSVLIASLGDRMPRGLVMIGGVTLYGTLVMAFSQSQSFYLSLGLMVFMGLSHVASHALVQTVIQTYSPREFRGRTTSMFHMTQVILMIGGLIVGALASWVGPRWSVTMMSLAGTAAMLGVLVFLPRARGIR